MPTMLTSAVKPCLTAGRMYSLQSNEPSLARAHVCDKYQHKEAGSTSEKECSTRTKSKP